MTERSNLFGGEGTDKSPYKVDGKNLEESLTLIAQRAIEDISEGKIITIDTTAGLVEVRQKQSGIGRVAFEVTPIITSRQDKLVQIASLIASNFTAEYITREVAQMLNSL